MRIKKFQKQEFWETWLHVFHLQQKIKRYNQISITMEKQNHIDPSSFQLTDMNNQAFQLSNQSKQGLYPSHELKNNQQFQTHMRGKEKIFLKQKKDEANHQSRVMHASILHTDSKQKIQEASFYQPNAQSEKKRQKQRVYRQSSDLFRTSLDESIKKQVSLQDCFDIPDQYLGIIKKDASENAIKKIQQSECFFEMENKIWEKSHIKILKNKMSFGPVVLSLDQVLKIKIFSAEESKQDDIEFHQICSVDLNESFNTSIKQNIKKKKINKLKISTIQRAYFIYQTFSVCSLSNSKNCQTSSVFPHLGQFDNSIPKFPTPFSTLSKIILKKIKILYPFLRSTNWDPPYSTPRVLIDKKSKKYIGQSPTKSKKINFPYIHGFIYKKSKHKLKWEKRYIIINTQGLFSYRDEKNEAYTFNIPKSSIQYIWTWFSILKCEIDKQVVEISNNQGAEGTEYEKSSSIQITQKTASQTYKHNENEFCQEKAKQDRSGYLILKIKYGFNIQTEFAIPICGFQNEQNKQKNWLFAFYKLISDDQQ